MTNFKTQTDIYRALLAGKRVRQRHWDEEEFLQLKDGILVNHNGKKAFYDFHNTVWQLAPEPPQVVEFEVDCDNTSVRKTFADAADHFAPILHGNRWRVVCTEIKDDQ